MVVPFCIPTSSEWKFPLFYIHQHLLVSIQLQFLKPIYHVNEKSASRTATAAAKSLQSCPTLCDPRDGSPPGSPVPGTFQARTLEWAAISFSKAWKWKVKGKSLSRVRLPATPWTAAHQAPPSMGFSRQEYWSGVPLPSPGRTPKNTVKICNGHLWNLNSWFGYFKH